MSIKEIHDALEKDSVKLQYKIDCLMPKAVKFFRKEKVFPAWQVYNYKIPSTNNQYILFFYVSNRNEIDHPDVVSFCIVFHENKRYVVTGMKMGYQQTPESDIVLLPQVHALTSHFLQQYNKRFWHDSLPDSNIIAGVYLIRNLGLIIPVTITEEVNRNVKNYGDHGGQGLKVKDGFCFTQSGFEGHEDESVNEARNIIDAEVLVYTTFVDESTMSDSQIEAINKECSKVMWRCMKYMFNPRR